MTRTLQRIAVFGALFTVLWGGSAPRQEQAAERYPTGLIPLEAKQVEEIVASWPRITKVNANWLGFERINRIRARKGKAPLDPLSIRPVGREAESSISGPGAAVLSFGLDPDLAGDLPAHVDNSELKYFPPIRNQSPLGSCTAFSTTYTQLSYMTAFQRDLDIRDNNVHTDKYSPKWTYNMVNGGDDGGSSFGHIYSILENHGACTWAEFPYDGDYRAWCMNSSAWRNALDVRTNPTQYVWDVSSDPGLEYARALLTDGYVLIIGTYITSWQTLAIRDDPSTADDDPEVGKDIGYWLNGTEGPHAMTIVGYNDAIWTDVNGDGAVSPGEKGAFRIANSWGIWWGDDGFIWLAYDALRSVSAVPFGPSIGRVPAFQSDMAFVLTVKPFYSPLMIAEFTVNHAKRNQLRLSLGRSETSAASPSTTWAPAVLKNQGGAYAFNGSTTALDGTFVLDFTDILVEGGGTLRYYLGMNDNASGDPAGLSAFKIIDLTTEPVTEAASSTVPQSADGGQQVYAYVDHAYSGPAYDHPPQLSNPQTDPDFGTTRDTYGYYVYYYDQDGDVPSVKNVIIDGSPRETAFLSGNSTSDGWYYLETSLPAGSHDFYFSFENGQGISARAPLAGATSGPEVYSLLLSSLQPSSALMGDPAFVLSVRGSDFVDGAVVRWDGSDRPTTFVNGSQVNAEIGAADLATGGIVQVTVRNPGGGVSSALEFTVNNPQPVLTSLSPGHASGGGTAFTLTLTGSDFVPGSVARWNGLPRTTTYVSGTELRAAIAAGDIAAGGEPEVTVTTPTPGGGASEAIVFPVSVFTMDSPTSSATVSAGESATYSIQVTPQFGSFDSPVSLKCTGLPRGCTSSFSPASVTPGAGGATATLTLATRARQASGAGMMSRKAGPGPPGSILLLLITVVLSWSLAHKTARRRLGRRCLTAGVLICLAVLISGCSAGGDGNSPGTGTPAGTYQVSVQGTSGTLAVSTTVTLVVR